MYYKKKPKYSLFQKKLKAKYLPKKKKKTKTSFQQFQRQN